MPDNDTILKAMADYSSTEQRDSKPPLTWLGAVSDLLLWAFVAMVIALGGYYFWVQEREAHRQLVRLSFRDANELTKGAMVRMMGTDFGYVKDIKIFPDRVDVWIKTNPNSLKIPSGSVFTIQFTGLVGGKSIEIIPPTVENPKIDGKPIYLVEEPIRLKDTLEYQIDIAQALQKGAENFSDFFGRKKPVEELQLNIRQAQQEISNANRTLTSVNTQIKQADAEAHQTLAGLNDSVANFSTFMREALETTEPTSFGPSVYGLVGDMGFILRDVESGMNRFQLERKLAHFNRRYFEWEGHLAKTRMYVDQSRLLDIVTAQQNTLEAADEAFRRAEKVTAKNYRSGWQAMAEAVRNFNQKVLNWIRQYDR